MRAAIYCRVSTDEQAANASLPTQEASCRSWCAEHGDTVVAVYADTASGTVWERLELQRLLADAQRGVFDLVVCHALDRLSRDPEHVTALRVLLGLAGVALACVTERLPEDDTGTLVAFVRGWAAKREWTQIRERTMRAKRALLERGVFLAASVPLYGYRHEDGRRVVCEVEADVVRRIYHWYVLDGLSLREIARRLNGEGVPAPAMSRRQYRDGRTPRWGKSTVRRILTDPAYIGETWALRWEARPGRNPRLRDPREWLRLPDGVTPAIVERSLWLAAQERLRQNHGERVRNAERFFLLRGLVRCAVCGRRMYADVDRGRRIYRCSSRQFPSGACGAGRVPADRIERWIWDQVSALLGDLRLIEAELERRRHTPRDDGVERQRASIERELARIAAQQERLVRRYARAEDDDDVLWELVRRQVAELETERERLHRRLTEIEQALAERERQEIELVSLAEYARRVRINLQRMDESERRQALEVLRVRVTASGSDPRGWSWAWG
ncbi:recombinase family protein (plasmid) [Thermomicrobium sp. 4228-Ro]|uniref:recombinase family protein n=1 Tax=Thermomicrobium sp. 4228-Ro TaxID=2993937 RepID=UPI002248C774|nr:recombinase family protein [Thermomicrobium sp. 4228-Ro]MCX2728572.1 recombinase family protein [Thermomicrobium sp. 4228-Ro]